MPVTTCVFDAYGTLFDYNSAAAAHASALGDKAAPLSDMWRLKQLQYTWLRSLMGKHAAFWQVTGEALDYAMEAVCNMMEHAVYERFQSICQFLCLSVIAHFLR